MRKVGATAFSARSLRVRDVVDRIKVVKTATAGGHGDVPVEDVLIERAEVC
jgi:hypothetical protein